MKPEEARAWLMLAAAAGVGWFAWRAWSGTRDAVAGIGAGLGDAWDRAATAAGDMADWVLEAPGRLGAAISPGGLVTVPDNPGRIVNWTGARNIDPLLAYFRAYGNSAGTRAQAQASGWTLDEISLAMAVLAGAGSQDIGGRMG